MYITRFVSNSRRRRTKILLFGLLSSLKASQFSSFKQNLLAPFARRRRAKIALSCYQKFKNGDSWRSCSDWIGWWCHTLCTYQYVCSALALKAFEAETSMEYHHFSTKKYIIWDTLGGYFPIQEKIPQIHLTSPAMYGRHCYMKKYLRT